MKNEEIYFEPKAEFVTVEAEDIIMASDNNVDDLHSLSKELQ